MFDKIPSALFRTSMRSICF